MGEDAEFDEFGDDWEWIFADQAFSEMRDDFERDMDAQGLQWGDGQPWWDVDRWASAWWADGRAGRDLCKTGAAAFVTWAHGMRRVAQEKIALRAKEGSRIPKKLWFALVLTRARVSPRPARHPRN